MENLEKNFFFFLKKMGKILGKIQENTKKLKKTLWKIRKNFLKGEVRFLNTKSRFPAMDVRVKGFRKLWLKLTF